MSIDPRIVIGCYAVDPVWYKVGQVMAVNGDRIRLQPLLGGPEWDALPAYVRPATPGEVMMAKPKATNAESRKGGRL
ncbi:hypothetical protein FHS39_000601 [Streptomyces olivoverticillatus]|uniref:Uncharacterized protein n=1 Tax=Streptomyces olivoverticillatus TaxID=66427 RepID=A0A7W7LL35_9ACTN|nr:hypothetical protein [Streptomyces olivoverticillatus]MBB4891601.1 hypothetical protein [Streptomyces olivoverticillatus]